MYQYLFLYFLRARTHSTSVKTTLCTSFHLASHIAACIKERFTKAAHSDSATARRKDVARDERANAVTQDLIGLCCVVGSMRNHQLQPRMPNLKPNQSHMEPKENWVYKCHLYLKVHHLNLKKKGKKSYTHQTETKLDTGIVLHGASAEDKPSIQGETANPIFSCFLRLSKCPSGSGALPFR
jgi:hypothetical protein